MGVWLVLFPRLVLPVWGCQFVVFGSLCFAWSGGVPEEFTSFYHLRVKSGKKSGNRRSEGVFGGRFLPHFPLLPNFFSKIEKYKIFTPLT